MVEDGKQEIQSRSGVIGRLATAFTKAGSVILNTASSAIFRRLALARVHMTRDNMLRGLVQTCDQVAAYESRIRTNWATFKEGLKAEAESDDMKQFYDSVSAGSLNCQTPKFVTRLNAFCNLLKSGPAPFMKMLGLGRDFKLPGTEQQ